MIRHNWATTTERRIKNCTALPTSQQTWIAKTKNFRNLCCYWMSEYTTVLSVTGGQWMSQTTDHRQVCKLSCDRNTKHSEDLAKLNYFTNLLTNSDHESQLGHCQVSKLIRLGRHLTYMMYCQLVQNDVVELLIMSTMSWNYCHL